MEHTAKDQEVAVAALDRIRDVPVNIVFLVRQARRREDLQYFAAGQFRQYERDARYLRKTILMWLAGVFDYSTRDVSLAILEELRMAHHWTRAKRLLETGTDPQIVIREAAQDELEIRTLREEIPTYLRSIRRDSEIPMCLEFLDDLDNSTQINEQLVARKVRREIIVGWPLVIQAVETGLRALKDDSIKQIPHWDYNLQEAGILI